MRNVGIRWPRRITSKPEVIEMARILGVSEREVAGTCMELWEWCDREGDFEKDRGFYEDLAAKYPEALKVVLEENPRVDWENGLHCFLRFSCRSSIDSLVKVECFADAMIHVGWLVAIEPDRLIFPDIGHICTGEQKREFRKGMRGKLLQ